jgi:hypothetical protein
MDVLAILALVAFVALGALFLIVLRRASQVFGETRRAATFRQGVSEVEERLDTDLAAMASFVDPVRRSDVPAPDEERFAEVLAATQESIAWARERSRDLVAPTGLEESRTVFMDELGRADEALRSIEHGVTVLSAARVGQRALEGRTSIKRGFLGLVHVRERLADEAGRVAAWRSPGERSMAARRERRADHRM